MPEYGKPAGRDILEGFELRLRDLERQVSALQGRRLLSVDRGTTTGVPAPVEGQVMVEETDEKLKWFSNGQWRTLTAEPGELASVSWGYILTGASRDYSSSSSFTQITDFNTAVVSTSQSDISGVSQGLSLNTDGLYLVTARLAWTSYTTTAGKIAQFQVGDTATADERWMGQPEHSGGLVSRHLWLWPIPEWTSTLKLYVRQDSGSDRNLYEAVIAAVGPIATYSGTPAEFG